MRKVVTTLASILFCILTTGAAIGAQDTTHFRFHDVSHASSTFSELVEGADARVRRLCGMLGICDFVGDPMDVYVADDPTEFASHFPPGNRMAERAVGVAFPSQGRIVLRAHGTAHFSLSETFDHEISHILVHRAAKGRHVARWFLEGVAIWQADESVIQELENAAGAAWHDDLYAFSDIERQFPDQGRSVDKAYAQSAIFVRWLYIHHGVHGFRNLLLRVREGASFNEAFESAYGGSVDDLAQEWAAALREETSLMMFLRDGNFLWVMMALLIVWAYFIKRKERRIAIAAMDDTESVQQVLSDLDVAETLDHPTYH